MSIGKRDRNSPDAQKRRCGFFDTLRCGLNNKPHCFYKIAAIPHLSPADGNDEAHTETDTLVNSLLKLYNFGMKNLEIIPIYTAHILDYNNHTTSNIGCRMNMRCDL